MVNRWTRKEEREANQRVLTAMADGVFDASRQATDADDDRGGPTLKERVEAMRNEPTEPRTPRQISDELDSREQQERFGGLHRRL